MFSKVCRVSAVSALAAGLAASAAAQPNALAHWTFDDTFDDASGNGRALVENGSVPFGVGQFGNAATFSGNGDNFLNNDLSVFDPGTGDFAVSFWYLTPNTGNQTLLGRGIEAFTFADQGYRVRLDGGNLQFRLLDNGNNNAQVAAPAIDTWHHVVVQRDGDEIELFLNGLEVANDLGNQNIDLTSGLPFTVGRRTAEAGSGAFTGSLDEIWVFDGPLSDAEVGNLLTLNSPVPEPAAASVLLLGAAAALRRRRG
ncbi:MAG: LamG domain-containing protein [Planctomycetota bacterium]